MSFVTTTTNIKCGVNFSEKLKEIPDKINENIGKKNYLAAAQLIVQAHENLQGPLQNVEGLKDVRSDLATKQEVYLQLSSLIQNKLNNSF